MSVSHMRRTVIAILALAALYLMACAALFVFERSLIYFPQPRSIKAGQSQLIVHATGANLVVTVRPMQTDKAVIYFGGNAEDVSLSLSRFSAVFPDYAVYLLHYRGFGGSTGTPSEDALHSDAVALFGAVYKEHKNITVVGRSLGSGVAIRLTAVRPVSRLVLVTPYDSLVDLAAQKLPYLPVNWLRTDKWESWRYAQSIGIPTTFLVAENDVVISNESSRKLYTRFPKNVADYVVIPQVGHISIVDSPMYISSLAVTR